MLKQIELDPSELLKAASRYPAAGIVAVAFGLKTRTRRLTRRRSVVFFVRRKRALGKIPLPARIPKTVRIGDRRLPTDVQELVPIDPQNSATETWDQRNSGTLTAYAKRDGELVGLTCAHCLTGVSGQSAAPNIEIKPPQPTGNWIEAGPRLEFLMEPGDGQPENFGYFDAGFFKLASDEAREAASGRFPRQHLAAPRTLAEADALLNLPVVAVGAETPGAQGVIQAVFFTPTNPADGVKHWDVRIDATTASGTSRRGDSGMLWVDQTNRAIALHASGVNYPNDPTRRSPFSYAMFVDRAVKRWDLALLS
jgi:hypothetical protein